ncbi:MAG: helix-turn-helix domain-containing protein [Candidatus Zixiibacteriota bacterium]
MIEFANEGEMLTVGKLLRNERERQELSLEDVSERTKINVKYLKAIEEDSKEGFPGELYCELFTKSYAEALGLEYAKIRAGTFAAGDTKNSSGKKFRKAETAAADKAKDKKRAASDKPTREKPKGPKFLPADSADDGSATAASDSADANGVEANARAAKKDIVKYFIIIAAIVFSLLMVVVYISISSDKTESGASDSEHSTDMPAAIHGDDADAGVDIVDDGLPPSTDDSFYVGPVQMYPDSLEVTLISTQESWASVIADSNIVFSSFFQPGKQNLFRAATELDITLGRWEFITGKIYTHPMKPITSFHEQGRNSVKLLITKDNWEAFIDSTQLHYDQR